MRPIDRRFPKTRMRRMRADDFSRRLMRESTLTVDDLIYPLFVIEGKDVREPIGSMPGVERLSVDLLVKESRELVALGVPAIAIFPVTPQSAKSELAEAAWDPDGLAQRAVRAVKEACPELGVITDVCLCEYTSHGHCGVVEKTRRGHDVANDATLKLLAKTAVSHAAAGADIVAPSDMMDGRVTALRAALDKAGHANVPIMAYAAKFASAFYGPFREVAESAPQFGDRRSYQMDMANGDEAMREVALDIEEGADIVLVKPGLPCLDLVRRVKETFRYPTAVYSVSAEYAMIKAGAEKGWIDERAILMESLLAMRRAGADILITYAAVDVARWLGEE